MSLFIRISSTAVVNDSLHCPSALTGCAIRGREWQACRKVVLDSCCCLPQQIKFAFGNIAAHEMIVSWSMHNEDLAEIVYWPVQDSDSRYDRPQHGKKKQKSVTSFLEKSAWHFTHAVHLTGLEASTQYAFYIRDNDRETATFNFKTGTQAPNVPHEFLVMRPWR